MDHVSKEANNIVLNDKVVFELINKQERLIKILSSDQFCTGTGDGTNFIISQRALNSCKEVTEEDEITF